MNGMDIGMIDSTSKRSYRSRSNAKSRQDGGSSQGNLSQRNSSQRFDGHPVILYERTENANPQSQQRKNRLNAYNQNASKGAIQVNTKMEKSYNEGLSITKAASVGRHAMQVTHGSPSKYPVFSIDQNLNEENPIQNLSKRYNKFANERTIKNQATDKKVQPSFQVDDKKYKYYCIFPGNGYGIIRSAFEPKENWREIKKDDLWKHLGINDNYVNFIWKPISFNYKLYCNIDNAMQNAYLYYKETNSTSKQLFVNHLEGHREITTKTGLIRSLKFYYKDNTHFIENNYQVFDTTPTSFVVSSKLETYEYYQFIKRFEDLHKGGGTTIKERVPQKHCAKNMWLVKPANENQGKGIKIFDKVGDIVRFLETSIKFSYWVIQKYLEKPLLYRGRKFDIRMWGLAKSTQEFYFYDVGYLRTSSMEYTMDNREDMYIHLTNNCLQVKDKETYGKHEEGNVVSIEQFQEYLNEQFSQYNLDFNKDFLPRMKDMAVDCYLSAKQQLNPNKRPNSFEFFGFDFMIDEDFRVWLIEVNTNPYIGIHNKSMKHILPEMFTNMFKVTIDPMFEKEVELPTEENNFYVGKFELLYSRNKGINKRRDVNEGVYPIKELDCRKTLKKFKVKMHKKSIDSGYLQQAEEQQRILSERRNSSKKRIPNELPERITNSFKVKNGAESKEVSPQPKMMMLNGKNNQRQLQIRIDEINDTISGTTKVRTTKNQRKASEYQISTQRESEANSSQLKKRDKDKLQLYTVDQSEVGIPEGDKEMIQAPTAIKIKPPKSIVQQVRNLDKNSAFIKQQSQEILNRIVATLTSWELFSDQQIIDSINALKMLYQTINFCQEQQMPIIKAITKLIGSNDVPIHIRNELAQKLLIMIKNKVFTRLFMQDDQDAFYQLKYLYTVLQENLSSKDGTTQDENDNEEYDNSRNNYADQEELQYQCALILVHLMSLNNSKYYIPGETPEKSKIRSKAMTLGIMVMLMHTYLFTQNKAVKQYLQEDFAERLEEQDILAHFANNHLYYERVSDLIIDSAVKQEIDEHLDKRLQFLKEARERNHRQLIEMKKEEEKREIQLKQEYDNAMLERRQLAEERMQQRLKQLQKIQNYQMKQELQLREQQEKDNEVRKQQMLEELKKKTEQRKLYQSEMLRKKKLEEREMEELELIKRAQREQERKIHLEEWHRNKRVQEKRNNMTLRQYYSGLRKKDQQGAGARDDNPIHLHKSAVAEEVLSVPPIKQKKLVQQLRKYPQNQKPQHIIDTSHNFSTSMIEDSFMNSSNVTNLNNLQYIGGYDIGEHKIGEPTLNSGLSMMSQQETRQKYVNGNNKFSETAKNEKKRRYLSTPTRQNESADKEKNYNQSNQKNSQNTSQPSVSQIDSKFQPSGSKQKTEIAINNRLYKSTIDGQGNQYKNFENHSQNLRNFRQAQENESKKLISNVSQRFLQMRNEAFIDKFTSPTGSAHPYNSNAPTAGAIQAKVFQKRKSVKSSKMGESIFDQTDPDITLDPSQILGKIKKPKHQRGISEIGIPQKYQLKLKPLEQQSSKNSNSISKEYSAHKLNLQEILKKRGSKQSLPAIGFSADDTLSALNSKTQSRKSIRKQEIENSFNHPTSMQIRGENSSELLQQQNINKQSSKNGIAFSPSKQYVKMSKIKIQDDNPAEPSKQFSDIQKELKLVQEKNKETEKIMKSLSPPKSGDNKFPMIGNGKNKINLEEIMINGESKDFENTQGNCRQTAQEFYDAYVDQNAQSFQHKNDQRMIHGIEQARQSITTGNCCLSRDFEESPFVRGREFESGGEFFGAHSNDISISNQPESFMESNINHFPHQQIIRNQQFSMQEQHQPQSQLQNPPGSGSVQKITIINNNYSQYNYNQKDHNQKYIKKSKKQRTGSIDDQILASAKMNNTQKIMNEDNKMQEFNAQKLSGTRNSAINQQTTLSKRTKTTKKKKKNADGMSQQRGASINLSSQQHPKIDKGGKGLIHQIYSVPISTKSQQNHHLINNQMKQSQIQILLATAANGGPSSTLVHKSPKRKHHDKHPDKDHNQTPEHSSMKLHGLPKQHCLSPPETNYHPQSYTNHASAISAIKQAAQAYSNELSVESNLAGYSISGAIQTIIKEDKKIFKK